MDDSLPDDGIGLFYLVSREVDDQNAQYGQGLGRLLTGPPGNDGVRQVGIVNAFDPQYGEMLLDYMTRLREGIGVKYLRLKGQWPGGVRIVVAPTDKKLGALLAAFQIQLDAYSTNIAEFPSSQVTETGTFARAHLKIA